MGGAGNDILNGQWGNDSYFWGAGQGHDRIKDLYADANGANTVVLRGLTPQDISVSFVGEDDYSTTRPTLTFTINATGETLSYQSSSFYDDWDGTHSAAVNFIFADGTQWDKNEAIRHSVALPTDAADVLIGTQLDDLASRLAGGAGDDLIVGRKGADVMEGGTGNDTLWGNAESMVFWDQTGNPLAPVWQLRESAGDSDTYVFGRGDGQDRITDIDFKANQDTLRFKAGLTAADLIVAQRGDDLVVQLRGSTDQVTINKFFQYSYAWGNYNDHHSSVIERFEFADGTLWNLEQIVNAAWQGTDQADAFWGNAQANVISGGLGDDVLQGGAGDGDDGLSANGGGAVMAGGRDADTTDAVMLADADVAALTETSEQEITVPFAVCAKKLLAARRVSGNFHCHIKFQQTSRWQVKSLSQTADIDQRNISLTTLNTPQITARQATVQSKTLLRHALLPTQPGQVLPKTHHRVVRQRSQRNGNRRMSGFGSSGFGHQLSVKNTPLSGHAL